MFKIDKNRVFTVKWNELKNQKDKLNKMSGIYFYHVDGSLKYVGKTDNFWSRFKSGYLNEEAIHNPELMKLIKSNSNGVTVVFLPMDKEDLKTQETLFIEEWIPLFNIEENPRYEIRPIQKVIGRVVNDSNNEWTYDQMREYLFHKKWSGKVSLERINEALRDEHRNLTRYCSRSIKKEILNPKKKEA